MAINLSKYENDLDSLIQFGGKLEAAILSETKPKELESILQQCGEETRAVAESGKALSFRMNYNVWYSESLSLIRNVLPDRLLDFKSHYEYARVRKFISAENYRIKDYLQGLRASYSNGIAVTESAAVPHFRQQLVILASARRRFESSLFDIRQMLQADLYDSELASAQSLAGHGFLRAAGIISGIVIEGHLKQICLDHSIVIRRKNPTIADFNEGLKAQGIIDVVEWRFIQHLADVRNLCGHSREREPTQEEISGMIEGTKKIIKTVI